MPYSGLMALGALAVVGTALGACNRRRSGGKAGLAAAAGDTAVDDGKGTVGETIAVTGIDHRLVAVMAAAIASASTADSHVLVQHQPGSRVNFWVLSGRQEQAGSVPPSIKWRSGR